MTLTVRKDGGFIFEYGVDSLILDPTNRSKGHNIFVSHAHSDHAAAFKYPEIPKYATMETVELLEAMGWRELGNYTGISVGDSISIGDLDVRVHNAGHILGSVMFEVHGPEESILYTGDISGGDSFNMELPEPVDCDMLLVESTFGAPMFRFPKRRDVSLEMIRWAVMDVIPGGRIPTIKSDSIGNAQEIIYAFNKMTNLPVVTAKSVTMISDVYQSHGYELEYIDSRSDEGQNLLDSGRCVLVTPKRSKAIRDNQETALASGWAVIMNKRQRAFPLSDHADFRSLIRFIRDCNPKRVLTFHGGSMTREFPKLIRKQLGIDAKPLTSREETARGTVYDNNQRIRICSGHLMRTIRIPGFVYTRSWLVKEMGRRGFTKKETQRSLDYLLERGILKGDGDAVKMHSN
ncbi:MAG: MBL fold metallo-hydrolase RNA specificity domain-containing protein [Candidatus Bathyarchaeia archaeon]